MANVRPVSDLRNQFPKIEKSVKETGEPVYLTKNGYGSMVLVSLEQYDKRPDPFNDDFPWTDDPSSPFCRDIDAALAWSLKEAEKTDVWYTGEEVFGRLRKRLQKMIDEQQKQEMIDEQRKVV